MCEPADSAETRRVDEGATSGEAGVPQLPGPLVEKSIDGWRERGPLDRNVAVGLNEYDEDVRATQAGQQLAARGGAEGVVFDLVGEDALVVDIRLHRSDLLDHVAGSARGGDGRVGENLSV